MTTKERKISELMGHQQAKEVQSCPHRVDEHDLLIGGIAGFSGPSHCRFATNKLSRIG
jgi:hypothetical protein